MTVRRYIKQLAGEYGVLSIEAGALGKPVVNFIKPSIRHRYPPCLSLTRRQTG